ncbi:MAG: hypothetical protein ACYCW6_13595 [Candidatus Xenobia bacterium]
MSLNNPITLAGRIERCWQLVYRTPVDELKGMLPPNLHLLRYGGFAFYNVSISKLRDIRPVWSPWQRGLSYWHIAYRLHASIRPLPGDPIEGLFFVHTDCNSVLASLLGNALTDQHFHYTRVEERADGVDVYSRMTPARLRANRGAPELAEGSPFTSMEEAQQKLIPPPCNLAITGWLEGNVVRVNRGEWKGHPCVVEQAEFSALRGHKATLEVCTEMEPIDCVWQRGRRVWLLG